MSIGDFVEKAKDFAVEHADQAEGLLDKASDMIKDKTPDAVDEKIDSAVEAAKDFLDKQ